FPDHLLLVAVGHALQALAVARTETDVHVLVALDDVVAGDVDLQVLLLDRDAAVEALVGLVARQLRILHGLDAVLGVGFAAALVFGGGGVRAEGEQGQAGGGNQESGFHGVFSPRGVDGGEHETRDSGAEEHHKDGIGRPMRARDDGATLPPSWNTMNMFFARPLALSLLASALVAGCASTPRLDRNLERIGFNDPGAAVEGNALFRRIGAEPTNARLHFDNGRFLLERGRRGDLEVARVAFANATRLA